MSLVRISKPVVGDEDVVLDPDATEVQQPVRAIPVDLVAQAAACLRVADERGDEVDARLDRDHVSRQQR